MNWDVICFTIDVEWAHPEVLAHVVRLFDTHGISATFFCTHAGISVPGHERALHPNFRRQGDTMRQLHDSMGKRNESLDEPTIYEHVVRTTRAFCPEATGVRSHSMFHDAQLFPIFARHKIEYDSGYFLPGAMGIQPTPLQYGILELPIYYMDHHDLIVHATGFRATNLKLDGPGLKVLDFHPNMVYINAVDDSHYVSTKTFYRDCERLGGARFPGRGVGTLLEEVLNHVVGHKLPTATLGEINREWRASPGAARCGTSS